MSGFAENTSVSPEKTKAEIEATLRRYGADQFVSGWDAERAFVMFRAKDRFVRFTITMPKASDPKFTRTATGKPRTPTQRQEEYEQACRTYWRRLLLSIKAKLESVATGIETFEEAFLAQIVLPDQSTMGDWAKHWRTEVNNSPNKKPATIDHQAEELAADERDTAAIVKFFGVILKGTLKPSCKRLGSSQVEARRKKRNRS